MAKKKIKKKKQAEVHEDLKGFDIRIDPFGKLESNMDIDKITAFLNENMKDKKLENRKEEEEE